MEWRFGDKHSFMAKLKELFDGGLSPKKVDIYMPHPDHDIEHLIEEYTPPSKLKYFTLIGGLTGVTTGFVFQAWSSLDYPIIVGGKPLLSWVAFVIVGFELTILFGALSTFVGMLLLGKFPKFCKMFELPEETGNEYVIRIEDEA